MQFLPMKPGDILSLILPGSIALVGLQAFVPTLELWISKIPSGDSTFILAGALLVCASAAGLVLEAITRITWEKYFLLKRHKYPDDILEQLPRRGAKT